MCDTIKMILWNESNNAHLHKIDNPMGFFEEQTCNGHINSKFCNKWNTIN